jgi:hypothetical protein
VQRLYRGAEVVESLEDSRENLRRSSILIHIGGTQVVELTRKMNKGQGL